MILGIDMGASAVKLCALEGGEIALTHYQPGRDVYVPSLLAALGVDPAKAERVAVTGLSARRSGLESLGCEPQYLPEPDSIGAGAQWLTGRDDLIVASIGTGTAFVHAKGGEYRHLCGTGVGGGTLRGLAQRVLGMADMRAFDALALSGDTRRVDLLIGDFVESYGQLDPYLTASNLARLDRSATDADWAAGLTNLVLQVIGTMSMMACQGTGAQAVAVIGAMAGTEASRANFANFTRAYGLEFLIPAHCECATANGAARLIS